MPEDGGWRRWLTISGLLAFTKILGMDAEEAEQICRDAAAAMKDKTIHAYTPQWVDKFRLPLFPGILADSISWIALGRKPEE
jgi:hypothetical protein